MLRDPLEKAGRSCEFFTMMRHPVSRLVSAFYFCPDDDRLDRPAKVWSRVVLRAWLTMW